MIYKAYYSDEIYHYGVKGQKWGVRRYQNKDGTLTDAGRKRIDKRLGNDTYLNPPNRGKKGSIERTNVARKYAEDYWEQVHTYSKRAGKDDYWKNLPSDVSDKIWTKYYKEYANATIKDLKLPNNQQVVDYLVDKYKKEPY